MPRVQPPGHTRACASCGAPRGNKRDGWSFVQSDDGTATVGVTCPDCPRWGEPVRRVETRAGARFRVVVNASAPGAPRRQVTRTLATLADARAFVSEVRARVERDGAYGPEPEGETVAALCERWLRRQAREVREVTAQGYRDHLAPALRSIGDRQVSSVTDDDVSALVEHLAAAGGRRGQPLGPRSVRGALGRLASAYDLAVREGTVSRNPFRGVRVRARSTRGTDLEHWPTEGRGASARCPDRDRFRQAADADQLAGAWRLSLAGLTRADVLGLRWSDVDTDAGAVTVRQGRVALSAGGDATDDPKSSQRRRTVPVEQIYPGTMAALRRMRAAQAADRLAAGAAWTDTGLVVVDALGAPLRPEVYSDRFRRLCAVAGVPVIRLHSLRHTLAFYLHALGVVPADAAALLGHTLEVHLATYLPEGGASGIAAAAAVLARAAEG